MTDKKLKTLNDLLEKNKDELSFAGYTVDMLRELVREWANEIGKAARASNEEGLKIPPFHPKNTKYLKDWRETYLSIESWIRYTFNLEEE